MKALQESYNLVPKSSTKNEIMKTQYRWLTRPVNTFIMIDLERKEVPHNWLSIETLPLLIITDFFF